MRRIHKSLRPFIPRFRTMIRLSYLLILALLCLPQSSCKRTKLYQAIENGDITTTQIELERETCINCKYEVVPIAALVSLPFIILLPVTDICLQILTLGNWAKDGRMPLMDGISENPLDAALDKGHLEIAALLQQRGAKAHYNTHYYGDFNTPPTKKPKVRKQGSVATTAPPPAPKAKPTTPLKRQSQPATPLTPSPSVGGATGTVSKH